MYRDHSRELIPIMSAWARSCQRPPRSRASSSRTSSHSCSESSSTPSKSKTTASITDGSDGYVYSHYLRKAGLLPAECVPIRSHRVVAVFAIDERRRRVAFLECDHLAGEQRVVAGVVLGPHAALEPRQRVGEQRRAHLAGPRLDPGPEADRRDAPREVRRDSRLIAAQDRDAEQARGAQQLVERDVLSDRDADERWVERQRDQRADRHADAVAVRVGGDHANAGWIEAHQRAQLVAGRHPADAKWPRPAAPSASPPRCGRPSTHRATTAATRTWCRSSGRR